MRVTTLTVLSLILLAAPALAQHDGAGYEHRGFYEDGTWTTTHTLHVDHTQGTATDVRIIADATYTCDCNGTASSDGFQIAAEEATGTYAVAAMTAQSVDDAWGFSFALPAGADGNDASLVLYVPQGTVVGSDIQPTTTVPSTDGRHMIYQYVGSAEAPLTSAWFTVSPGEPVTVVQPEAPEPEVITKEVPVRGFDWLALVLGLVAGAAVWAVLVGRGHVQARSRRQVVTASAHSELASKQTRAVLEGRKRVLMAGLKELELAKMNQEMDTAAYDALKAEYKKETVTVMRALEAAPED